MIKIYTPSISSRLEYVCTHLFRTILGIDFKLYTQADSQLQEYDICYSKERLGNGLHIVPTPLLFESDIRRQEITFGDWEGFTTLFVSGGEIPFDLFAASFFLLSRKGIIILYHFVKKR